MYSFSIYDTSGPRAAQSVQWTEDSGYFPAMTTSFTTGTTAISIKNFADDETIAGTPAVLVYTQVAVTNNGSSSISLDPGGTGLNLVRLTSSSLDTVAPGATSDHEYVAAVDNFGAGIPLPSAATLTADAPSEATADSHMTAYWNGQLAATPTISLPNLTLPNTNSLASPGTALDNAYKAGTIYNLIMQSGEAQFSAADNYAWLLNHDVPGILIARFEAGDSTAYNTAYASNGLYGTEYRDLPITSYAWQIATTTGGPNAWWEANGSGPSASNPWIGDHAGPEFGASPYAWPISAQRQGLLEALVAQGLSSTGSGPFTFTQPLYIGRGIPSTWIAAGQTISVANITDNYNVTSGARSTYGVSLAVTKPGTGRVITVSLTGTLPAGAVDIQLPIFTTVAVSSVTGGTYNSSTQTVTAATGATTITLAS